jgi:hypothetical protein
MTEKIIAENDKETLRRYSDALNKWMNNTFFIQVQPTRQVKPITLGCPREDCPFWNKCYNDIKKCKGVKGLSLRSNRLD